MLAALLIAMQMIARQLQAKEEEREVLRALGASRAMDMGDGLLGILGAVVLGSLLAVGIAIGLSPLSPIGPVRAVYPDSGVAFDCGRCSASASSCSSAASGPPASRSPTARSRHEPAHGRASTRASEGRARPACCARAHRSPR